MNIEDARREYNDAVGKVGKAAYLNGNGGEKRASTAFMRYAQLNNQDPTRPHVMTPKKKYRRG